MSFVLPSGSNKDRVVAVQERRRSGAAGKHGDRRLKRQRDRGAAKRRAIFESRDR